MILTNKILTQTILHNMDEINELIAMYLQPNADIRAVEMNEICTKIATEIGVKLVGTEFLGSVIPTDTPTGTGKAFWLATQAGTYTNFGAKVVSANSFAVIARDALGVFSISQTALDITSKVNVTDIKNDLISTDVNKPLSANQGKVLNEITAKKQETYELIGEAILNSYPKDFSILTTTTPNPSPIWINNTPLTTRGRLSSMRVKVPVGATIVPYVYSISGTSGSFVYTLLKTYNSFVTTSLEHTQTINDNFILEIGQFIGFKSSLGIYYTLSGSGYSTANPSIQTQTYSMDFVININANLGVKDRVLILETANTPLQANVAVPVLKSYPKDFSILNTTTSNGSAIWMNNTQVLTRGKLYSIRVKVPVGSLVTPYVYSISGVSGSYVFTLLKTYNSFTTTSLEHTQNIADEFILEIGQYVAFKSSAGIYYTASGLGISTVATAWQAQTYGLDFFINENTVSGLNNRIASLESTVPANSVAIASLQNTSLLSVPLKPSILYRNVLSSISDFTAVNWTLASGGGAQPTGIGSANHLWLKKRYHVNPRTLSINVTLLADSVFYIECAPLDYVQNNGVFVIDIPNNRITINNIASGVLTQTALGTIPFTFVSGRKYVIDATILNFNNKLSIKDTVTSDIFSISYLPPTNLAVTENTQSDSYKFYLNSGTTTGVKINSVTISSKLKPLVLLIGDSITAGVLFPTVNEPSRYGRLLETKLKGNLLISARGGANVTDVSNKLETELAFIKPDYCMLTIGTNLPGFSQAAMTTIVNRIIELGSVPIINHVPNRADGSHIATNNTLDAVCLATGAIKGALFDVATSISNNPANSYVVADYFDAGVHPNVSGQLKMYNRFEIDLPFLFS